MTCEAFRLADAATAGEQLGADSGGEQAAQRLALFLPLDDRLVQPAQPVESAGLAGRHALGELAEQPLDPRLDGRRRRPLGAGDRLDRPAGGDLFEQPFVLGGSAHRYGAPG